MKHYSPLDRLLIEIEHSLRTSFVKPPTRRPCPAADCIGEELDADEARHAAGLMRVNNAGEVAAQGLYRGQAALARKRELQEDLMQAAEEENEHLNWCQTRLEQLGERRSLLDPLWYWGSFAIGAGAAAIGDRWSLGFVEETENQVTRHLEDHLQKLPPGDECSRRILEQMKEDEMRHATQARKAGAAPLPGPVRRAMTLVSWVMTGTAYRL